MLKAFSKASCFLALLAWTTLVYCQTGFNASQSRQYANSSSLIASASSGNGSAIWDCTIAAGTLQALYFPPKSTGSVNGSGAASTLVSDGYTLSVYDVLCCELANASVVHRRPSTLCMTLYQP